MQCVVGPVLMVTALLHHRRRDDGTYSELMLILLCSWPFAITSYLNNSVRKCTMLRPDQLLCSPRSGQHMQVGSLYCCQYHTITHQVIHNEMYSNQGLTPRIGDDTHCQIQHVLPEQYVSKAFAAAYRSAPSTLTAFISASRSKSASG